MPPGSENRSDPANSPCSPRAPEQSIPLQDLSRPPDDENARGRTRITSGSRWVGGASTGGFSGRANRTYKQIVEETSQLPAEPNRLGVSPLQISSVQGSGRRLAIEDAELSPIDLGQFAGAMHGMDFGGFGPIDDDDGEDEFLHKPPSGQWTRVAEDSQSPSRSRARSADRDDDGFELVNTPVDEDDRAPLADPRYLQPISGSSLPAAAQPHDRIQHKPSGSKGMLGADLHEAAVRERGHHKSYSSTSTLSRSGTGSRLSVASSMLRKMSTRVVNLSSDPEVIDQARRSASEHGTERHGGFPDFNARTSYDRDHSPDSIRPVEKAAPLSRIGQSARQWQQQSNPLKGRTLGIFGPDNKLRLFLCDVLIHSWTEPLIFFLILLQTVILAVSAGRSVVAGDRDTRWPATDQPWVDYILLGLFGIYTAEIVARTIVSGFIKNASEYSTVSQDIGFFKATFGKTKELLIPGRQLSVNRRPVALPAQSPQQLSILRSFTMMQAQEAEDIGSGSYAQRVRLARRAFLRHSFNRLDFLAVVSYWITFVLRLSGAEATGHVYVFQMLSCLRITRLLGLTNGTSVILRSLKKAAPSLLNVAFLIGFFWLLFGIIAAQSFKASLRRTCVWFGGNASRILNGEYNEPNIWEDTSTNLWYAQNLAPENLQFCGGFLDPTNDSMVHPFVTNFSTPQQGQRPENRTSFWKGYICPSGSICVEGGNPYNNTVSFDNIGNALELVFVVMSANTYSDLLYYLTDSDYLAVSIFFVVGIVVLAFWMTNLLIAVITSSFQIIREESKVSAFTSDDSPLEEEEVVPRKQSTIKRIYDKTFWFWIVLITIDIIVMCLRTSDRSNTRMIDTIDYTETVVTLILLLEILVRFVGDWRNFFRLRRNWVDLTIAVVTAVMQLPVVHNSGAPYDWLTIFQIVRIYRVILAITITRELILLVLGNVSGILNLIVFVFLVTFIGAIFASQIMAGDIYQTDWNGTNNRFTFANIWLSFLAMYQILSSENWTFVLYNSTQYQNQFNTAWISALFFILWFIFANFIILNMFIAVIQENFDVDEDTKRLEQVKAFLQQKELSGATYANLSLSTILGFSKDGAKRDPIDYGPATIEMFKDTVVRDFLDEQIEAMDEEMAEDADGTIQPTTKDHRRNWLARAWDRVVHVATGGDNPFYTSLAFSRPYEDLDPRTLAQEIQQATAKRKDAQRKYLVEHPRYNVSLWIFAPDSPVRRFCQKLVGPGRGSKRIQGIDPDKKYWYPFSAFIYAHIIGMVLLACYVTPLFQRDYFLTHGWGSMGRNWFTWTDIYFAAIFTFEALVKIIADGFFFTPNAYFRGTWGIIDAVVLITLWISIITSLANLEGIARGAGAFKALRALRLLNVSNSARDTFHSVIIVGGWKVLSAGFVSLSLLIPFAIYGVNLFNGRYVQCNDPGLTYSSNFSNSSFQAPVVNLSTDCTGEFQSTPYVWPVLAPRQAMNPYYDFDNFRNSLFILFQIVSEEGWIDVMWSGMSATTIGQNPQPFASQGNAVFFVVFNLLSTVFVGTLFISVFMRNYTEQTGVAFLTADQRSWLELRKLLRRISPSKRPQNRPDQKWKDWCYKIAVKKHGPWHRTITTVLTFHLALLTCEFYPIISWWENFRDGCFLLISLIMLTNVVIRITGLTWQRFRRSSWDLYSVFSVTGALVTTLFATVFSNIEEADSPAIWVHKLFLVSLALLLIPRNNALDQLFKTAAASLTAIVNLLATWFVLFLVFAIAMNQTLGLTKFMSMGKANLNLRTVPKALILLFRMSTGEGWNQIMEDFALAVPPKCVSNTNFFESDCGSEAWARVLFVLWNLVSMYIFVSLFVSLIFESFSYVYQRSSGHSLVSREETRRFKQAWATFDPNGTGYISKEAFPKLLGELSGVFEMRIYDGDHTVGAILEDCKVDNWRPGDKRAGVVDGVDIAKLNERLRTINVNEIRRRRQRLNVFSQEILVSAHPDRGISFTSCLMILAHYNVISDSRSLRLEEFLRRRYRLQRVEEEVHRRIVIGFFDTLFWSRQFRRKRGGGANARMVQIPQFAVPEIVVEEDPLSPKTTTFPEHGKSPSTYSERASSNLMPEDASPFRRLGFGLSLGDEAESSYAGSTRSRSGTLKSSGESPTRSARDRAYSTGSSPSRPGSQQPSPSISPSRRPSAPPEPSDPFSLYDGSAGRFGSGSMQRQSTLSGNGTQDDDVQRQAFQRHRRQKSSVGTMNHMDVFDNSAWGESIKRSFTTTRKQTRKGRSRGKSDAGAMGNPPPPGPGPSGAGSGSITEDV